MNPVSQFVYHFDTNMPPNICLLHQTIKTFLKYFKLGYFQMFVEKEKVSSCSFAVFYVSPL